ncbi:MAG: serine--tRNA ligase [Candidatus Micrarchaeaceae archaeon]
MITTKYIRDNIDEIRKSMEKRRSDYPIDELLKLDENSRKINTQIQELQKQRNIGSKEISELKKQGKKIDETKVKELANIGKKIQDLENKTIEEKKRIDELLWNMPNILDESVPYGKDDAENIELKRFGNIKKHEMPSHTEILEKLNLIDLEQAAKVSGARFYYLRGELALLEQALIRFAIDRLTKKDYELLSPPLMIKKDYYRGSTALGDFEEALYKIADTSESKNKTEYEKLEDDLFLISTSEHSMAVYNAEKVFTGSELPKKYIAVTPCFRREAGSHGKDTKGIFRVHHFYKVEQFVVSKPENSEKFFEEIINNAEELVKELELPYRIINICTGDIGTVAAKKYDIEVYMPSQNKFREIVSGSNCTNWQSLRLDIKYDELGKRNYVHTLNCTAIATTRIILGIVENNFITEKNIIKIPNALIPYMNGKKEIKGNMKV